MPSEEVEPTQERVTVVRDGNRVAVFGDDVEVMSYVDHLLGVIAEAKQALPIRTQNLTDVAAGASAVSALSAASGSMLVLTPESVALVERLGRVPAEAGSFHTFVRDGGRISNQLRFMEAPHTGAQLLSLQLAIATMSLRTAIKGVQEAVDRVEQRVDVIAQILEAESIGNVVSQHQFLRRLVDADAVTAADWDVIGPLGQPIHASTASLSRRLFEMVDAIDAGDDAAARAKSLGGLVDKNRLPETLALLLVARQAEFLWHALRLQRIADTEPERLAAAKAYADELLLDSLDADRRLIAALDAKLTELGTMRPLEVLRKLSAGRIDSRIATLREALKRFSEARSLHFASHGEGSRPTVSDAVKELQTRSDLGMLRLSQTRSEATEFLLGATVDFRERLAESRRRDRQESDTLPRLFRQETAEPDPDR